MEGSPCKRCSTCGEHLPLSQFNVRRAAADGLQSRCRACCAAWYRENRERHLAAVRRNVDRRNAENRRAFVAYLLEHPCVDCGESDLRVLDMDHRDPTRKRANVARLLNNGVSWERLVEELDECDVRCANCHRRRTAASERWWRHGEQLAQEALRTDAHTRLRCVLRA